MIIRYFAPVIQLLSPVAFCQPARYIQDDV